MAEYNLDELDDILDKLSAVSDSFKALHDVLKTTLSDAKEEEKMHGKMEDSDKRYLRLFDQKIQQDTKALKRQAINYDFGQKLSKQDSEKIKQNYETLRVAQRILTERIKSAGMDTALATIYQSRLTKINSTIKELPKSFRATSVSLTQSIKEFRFNCLLEADGHSYFRIE